MRPLASALTVALVLLLPPAAKALPGDEIYAKAGQLVLASDGAKLNFYCMGAGSPAVIFDAGDGDWSAVWAAVQPRVAQWTRACSYDRAGLGFSELGPKPRTVERLAQELHSALHKARIKGPYILVGHAFGGYAARAFADNYLSELAGMVLIEGDARDLETSPDMPKIWQGIYERNLASLRFCGAATAGTKLPLTPPADHPTRNCNDYSFRGLPEAQFSLQLNSALENLVATKSALFEAGIGEHEAWWTDDEYLKAHRKSLGRRPLRIITADQHIPDRPDTTEARRKEHAIFNREHKITQARMLDLSSNAKQILTQTGPFVQLDRPDIVIDAIREVYEQAK